MTKTVTMTTAQGSFTIELDEAKAPLTVQNFLSYVRSGHYDGTVFHRVIKDFMIQGGGIGRSRCERRRCVVGRAASSPTPSQHIRRKL